MNSYQLIILLDKKSKITIGKLGTFLFLKGKYVYTGSAKKNMDKRITRHLSKDKKLRWHIDYFLYHPQAKVLSVYKSNLEECSLNMKGNSSFPVKGFGSSDCKNNCPSHFKYLGIEG